MNDLTDEINGKNSKKPDDVGRSLGGDGGGLDTKEGSETGKLQEKGPDHKIDKV